MGASGWDYFVPYQEDPNAALTLLRERVFSDGDYLWDPVEDDEDDGPDDGDETRADAVRPRTIDELWENESVQESGTHSVLDVFAVVGAADRPRFGTVQVVSAAEAHAAAGTELLTRAHVDALRPLARERGIGRCAVLHDAAGRPEELYFWGFSGD